MRHLFVAIFLHNCEATSPTQRAAFLSFPRPPTISLPLFLSIVDIAASGTRLGERTRAAMKSGAKEQYADGSFMRIEVVSMLKLVFLTSISLMLLCLFVIIGFGSSPTATTSDWTSRPRRCTSDFSWELYQTCSGDNQTVISSVANESIIAIDKVLSLPESERTTVLSCMLDSCSKTTNRPFDSYVKHLNVVHYSFAVNGIQQHNRYFYLEVIFPNQKPSAEDHSFEVTMTPRLKGLYMNETRGNQTSADLSEYVAQQTDTVLCSKGESACSPLYFSRLRDIYFSDYQVDVVFNSTKSLPLAGSNVYFRKTWGTIGFTNWLVGIKLFFLFVSAAVAAWYIAQVNALSAREQNIEQGWVAGLVLALVLFNDPFYIAEVSFGSNPARLLSVGFQVTFLQFLLLFWLLALDNMRLLGKESGVSNTKFFRPKVSFLVFYWIMMVLFFGYTKYNSNDGGVEYDPLATNSNFALVRAICAMLGVFYVLWYAYLLIVSLEQLRARRVRYRYLTLLNSSMVVLFFIALASGSYLPAPPSGGHWTAPITIFNLYVFTLCYLYSPSASALAAAKQRKQEQVGENPQDLEASPAFLAPVLPAATDDADDATATTIPAEPTPIELPEIQVRDMELA